jgi:beta-N-acetylhexosaminidase
MKSKSFIIEKIMQSIKSFLVLTILCVATTLSATPALLPQTAAAILHRMTLKEKIGQKLMLDFRYWCETSPASGCTQDLTTLNPIIQSILSRNHIGGIILFANNLKDIAQITTLNYYFQQVMLRTNNLPLLIGTDQEGGIVARLPRDASVTFPGNMAIAAAYLGQPNINYSKQIGKVLANDLKAVGINIDFAPDVDVNLNPANPVIHVRSFSDDPILVSQLGEKISLAIQAQGVGASLKHFPGHGDTNSDSHLGLPLVNHTLQEAWQIDLYPFKVIINESPPDLIMTAHIQYPALDATELDATRAGQKIIAPASLSRRIQHDLLRNTLDFQGVIITDALDMGAIAQNFEPTDATIKAFQAGDDIALMPVEVRSPADANKVTDLIDQIEMAVLNGKISERELNDSVLRIIKLKMKLGLLQPDEVSLSQKIMQAQKRFANPNQRALESAVTDAAITLVQNNNQVLPLQLLPTARIHILTPWQEQGAGIAHEIARLQTQQQLPAGAQVDYVKMADTNWDAEKVAIDHADIVIVGDSTTFSTPLANNNLRAVPHAQPQDTLALPDILPGDEAGMSPTKKSLLAVDAALPEAQFAYQALQYAKAQGKKTLFISLLAPYDLPNYKDVADVLLAGYDFYGYLGDATSGYNRGPSMPALTRIIFGISPPKGKLPINIPNPSNMAEIVYPRGFGLTIS